ncbi:MAG TPA: flagellar motor protein MotB [Azoarcus sp.]|nr:flagellar motor protein MotB [Azoarcus sp.]
MSKENQPIVIRRPARTEHSAGHGGGAWKIAYADFVTAMMAFFILLWLIGSTADSDLKGISDFFRNPVLMAQSGGDSVGDSALILPGGGEDLTRTMGQVRRHDLRREIIERDITLVRPDQDEAREVRERAALLEIKGRIEALIEAKPNLRAFRNQILLDITPEGLRIQIVDQQNRPMFDLASAELRPHTRELLHIIGGALNTLPNRLSLSGHTDALQYPGQERGFSNWELSANRANASRRELITGGLDPLKVARVVGHADILPFNPDDPYDASNRRISIVVMNKRTEETVLEGRLLEVNAQELSDETDALLDYFDNAVSP